MTVNYVEGSILGIWYDTWLVALGFALTLALTFIIITRGERKGVSLAIAAVMVLALIVQLPLMTARAGFYVAVADFDTVGIISLFGSLGALVVGAAYLVWTSVASRRGESIDMSGQITPVQGLTGQGINALDDQTATLVQGETPAGGVPTMGGASPSQAPTAWLHITSGPRAGQTIPIQSDSVTIGRASDNDVVLDDASVSRTHARISYRDGQFRVDDAGSMSGTLVEGSSAAATVLSSGMSLKFGETEMVFMQGEATAVADAPQQGAAETIIQPQQRGLMAWLAVTSGPDKGKTYQVQSGDNTIGRASENNIVIEDRGISRLHAILKAQEDSFILVDLGSAGGTRVGERKLEGKSLRTGETISVGQTTLRLVEVEGQDAVEQGTMSGATVVDQPGSGSGGVLIAQSGPDAGKSYSLAQGDNIIGRESDCSVMLTDGSVSRHHAMIRKEEDRFVVFDLGSRTGTKVEDATLTGYRLIMGETISMGRSELVLMQIGS